MTQSNITAQSLPSEAESPQSALGESPAAPVKGETCGVGSPLIACISRTRAYCIILIHSGESFASLSELSAEGLPLPLEVAEERLAAMGAHKVFEKVGLKGDGACNLDVSIIHWLHCSGCRL